MMATEMPAAIRPYSIAVAPLSSFRKRILPAFRPSKLDQRKSGPSLGSVGVLNAILLQFMSGSSPARCAALDIEDNGACFIVRDNNGQALSYVYYETEPRPTDCREPTDAR
jgi:hypothetical protein